MCVISDNHSTDHTVEVIEKYAEKYSIRVHRNESNIGILANIVQTAASLPKADLFGCWAMTIFCANMR